MNADTRLSVVARLQQAELGMIDTKGREYTGGAELGNQLDTLRNFKSVGERIGVHPLQAWSVYFLKHMDSILTFVQDTASGNVRELSEPIEGRIVDARTYLGLLQCLIDEYDRTPFIPDPEPAEPAPWLLGGDEDALEAFEHDDISDPVVPIQ